jgi:hypothetical protein
VTSLFHKKNVTSLLGETTAEYLASVVGPALMLFFSLKRERGVFVGTGAFSRFHIHFYVYNVMYAQLIE